VPAHLQIIARSDECLFEILDGHVQDAKLEIREAGPEETLRLQHPIFFTFRQKPKCALERAERALVIPHGKP
jgi:hypothetical protein